MCPAMLASGRGLLLCRQRSTGAFMSRLSRGCSLISIQCMILATACGQTASSIVEDAGAGGMYATGGAKVGGTRAASSTSVAPGTAVGGRSTTLTAGASGGVNSSAASTATAGNGGRVVAAGGSTATNSVGGTSATGGSAAGGASSAAGSKATGGSSTTKVTATAAFGGGSASGGAGTGGAATGGAGVGGQITTPASASAKFPFPQNRRNANCVYPTLADYGDVQRVYEAWKKDLVVTDKTDAAGTCANCARVLRPHEPGLQPNSTVSEGIAYGMLITVYMNDQPLFDGFWRYALAHPATAMQGPSSAQTILMDWYVYANGKTSDGSYSGSDPKGNGAATDADEDMAFALIMADKQWGGKGSLNDTYSSYAKKLLADIWKYEVDQSDFVPKNGSGWGGINCLNISYFAPAYYRTFGDYTGEGRWKSNVVSKVYSVISASLNAANGNQSNGLVPAFSTGTGGNDQCGANGASNQKHWYQYDSCRTPFRIGVDACWNSSSDAKSYVSKTTSFFAPKGAEGIADGYELNGTDKPEFPGGTYKGLSAAFIGPAGVGAMASADQQVFIDDVYSHLTQNNMWTGGQYYDESWTLLSLLMMTGNFLDYTKYN